MLMRKEEKKNLTREKLLASTEKLIENTDDPFKVTSRQIAGESGMQAAMINYCFGSRENLIYRVFEKKYESALSDHNVLAIVNSDDLSPSDKLKELHFIIARFLINDFKYTKAITNYVLFKRDLSKEAFSVKYVMEHYKGTKSLSECKIISYELSTMLQLIIYRKDDFKCDMGIDLYDDNELRNLINLRIDLLLGEVKP